MAAKGVLCLGQAMLRRTILRPQVLLGIRRGLLWINYKIIGLLSRLGSCHKWGFFIVFQFEPSILGR